MVLAKKRISSSTHPVSASSTYAVPVAVGGPVLARTYESPRIAGRDSFENRPGGIRPLANINQNRGSIYRAIPSRPSPQAGPRPLQPTQPPTNVPPPPIPEDGNSLRAQIARNLILARHSLGVTQDQLADRSGISRATIAQIESGGTDCRLGTLHDIAGALSISPVLLFIRESDWSGLIQLVNRAAVDSVLAHLSDLRIAEMRQLRESGLQKHLIRLAQVGVAAAEAAGYRTPGSIVGASIGSVHHPGLGTAVGAVFGSMLGIRHIDPPPVEFGGGI